MHIRAEHLHLFPSILKAVEADSRKAASDLRVSAEFVRDTIGQLKIDHNFFMHELGESVKQTLAMREDRGRHESGELKWLRAKIDLIRARLEHHNELEEIYVYAWAEKLNLADEPDLRAKIQKELENLPPRFHESN